MFVLPHSVITVSIVTALLPRMSRAAHDRRLRATSPATSRGGMRSAAALIVPAAVALVVLGHPGRRPALQLRPDLHGLGTGHRPARRRCSPSACCPFTLYYVVLRGWYALEQTRTAFWITVVLNVLNLAIAVPAVQLRRRERPGSGQRSPALAFGYVASYWITLVVGLGRAVPPARRPRDRPHPARPGPDGRSPASSRSW